MTWVVGTDPFFREPFVWLDQSYEEALVYLSESRPHPIQLTSADGDTYPAFYYIVSTPPIMLLVKLLSPNATMPTRFVWVKLFSVVDRLLFVLHRCGTFWIGKWH